MCPDIQECTDCTVEVEVVGVGGGADKLLVEHGALVLLAVAEQHLHSSPAESEPGVQVQAGTPEIRCVRVRVDKQGFSMKQWEVVPHSCCWS